MADGRILYAHEEGVLILRFEGDIRFNICSSMDKFIDLVMKDEELEEIFVDASHATGIDSTALGVLAEIAIEAEEKLKKKPLLFVSDGTIQHIIQSVNFDKIFTVVKHTLEELPHLTELPHTSESEQDLARRILQAHKRLMTLTSQNREFKDVVEAMERDLKKHEHHSR